MSNLNFQTFNIILPYAADNDASIANIKTLANFIGEHVPGLHWDESLSTTSAAFYHREFICSDVDNVPVIAVHNYNYSSSGRQFRGIGYGLLNHNKGLISEISSTGNNENGYGQYWYPYTNSSATAIYIHVLTGIEGITLFDICSSNKISYKMFITDITPAGTDMPTNPTVFKYYDGTITYATGPIVSVVGDTTSQSLPWYLSSFDTTYYLDKVRLNSMEHCVNHIKAFSGLGAINSQYQIIRADSEQYITVGLRTADKWQPIVPLA